MAEYNLSQWLFFFYVYCFIGWIWESTYVSVKQKKLVNRGFMKGPLLPIYGSGAVIMILCSNPVKDNVALTFLFGMLGATILEYFTGAAMEKLFGVRYWDYSDKPLNLNGHIYYASALLWGVFSVLLVNFIHPPIERLMFAINSDVLRIGTFVVTVFASADFGVSFKAALDFKAVLTKLTENNEEIRKIRDKVEEITDSIEERSDEIKVAVEEKKLETMERTEERKLAFENMMERRGEAMKNLIMNVSKQSGEKVAEEFENLINRYMILKDRAENKSENLSFAVKNMVRNNPSIASKKFSDALSEVKKNLNMK